MLPKASRQEFAAVDGVGRDGGEEAGGEDEDAIIADGWESVPGRVGFEPVGGRGIGAGLAGDDDPVGRIAENLLNGKRAVAANAQGCRVIAAAGARDEFVPKGADARREAAGT